MNIVVSCLEVKKSADNNANFNQSFALKVNIVII